MVIVIYLLRWARWVLDRISLSAAPQDWWDFDCPAFFGPTFHFLDAPAEQHSIAYRRDTITFAHLSSYMGTYIWDCFSIWDWIQVTKGSLSAVFHLPAESFRKVRDPGSFSLLLIKINENIYVLGQCGSMADSEFNAFSVMHDTSYLFPEF